MDLQLEAERVSRSRFIPKWVWHEHQARYEFTAGFVVGRLVIDCACGDGAGTEVFLRQGARRIWAFDVSTEAVNTARHRCKSARAHFQVADSLNLPLPDGCAEVYVSLETIEHINDDQAFLREITRVLAKDGVFICSTPNRTVTNPGKDLADRPWNEFHVREYSQEEFAGLLRERFAQVRLFGQNPQPRWKVRIMRIIGSLRIGHLAVYINQVMKLPSLVLDQPDFHIVREIQHNRILEYLVAVCKEPRK